MDRDRDGGRELITGMWMQQGKEACEHQNQHQVVNLDGSRKLRPLIPWPLPSFSSSSSSAAAAAAAAASSSSSSSQGCSFGLYTAGSVEVEPNMKKNSSSSYREEESNSNGVGGGGGRWNPTREQVRALEELYRSGTRTPSTEQIQRITAQLRRFGDIEGKNVFYWFQNHKARERQKLKRRRSRQNHPHLLPPGIIDAEQQQPRSHYPASQGFGEMSIQLQRGVSVQNTAAAAATTNAIWRNLVPSSDADGVTCKTRRLVATDQTTTRKLLHEEDQEPAAPLLQLFPLTTLVNAGQHHHHHVEEEDASKEFQTDQLRFFEFLPPNNNIN